MATGRIEFQETPLFAGATRGFNRGFALTSDTDLIRNKPGKDSGNSVGPRRIYEIGTDL